MESEKRSRSTLSSRHEAETRKFEAETRALVAEAAKLDQEAKRMVWETELERLSVVEEQDRHRFGRNTDVNNRTYSLVTEIDSDEIDDLVDKVNAWARESDLPITIRLNSPGGDVYIGLALFDQLKAIDQFKAPITTVAMGMTASMAGLIFQAGRVRLISPNATLLVHEASISGMLRLDASQMEDMNKSLARLNSRLFRILAERSTLSAEEIQKRAKKTDWEIDAEEAVSIGFADKVGYV